MQSSSFQIFLRRLQTHLARDGSGTAKTSPQEAQGDNGNTLMAVNFIPILIIRYPKARTGE
ncbi:MAG: hypothetical protein DWH87_00070 [Planctomycetota bacterium]|nr:MAG: hypothetical protein DWH87_00070 [Planctomycetota bacterium]